MQVVLVMFRAEGERRSFSIVRDVTVIGRREDCDLRIPVGDVSRKHCRLIKEGDSLRLEDLGSSNGTFHNGQRVQGTIPLEPGDNVQVGPVVFVVQIDGVPPDDTMDPFTARAAHQLEDSLAPATGAQVSAPEVAGDDELSAEDLEMLPGDDGLELEPAATSEADGLELEASSDLDSGALEPLEPLEDDLK